MVALVLLLIGALGMTLSENLSVALGASVLMALGMGVNNAAVFKLAPQEVHEAVGGAAGWIGGLGAFGGYATGFGVFVALSTISIAVVWLLQRASHARTLGAGVRGSAVSLLVVAALASASGAGVARAESGLTGAELYEEHCELCHEADGLGDPGEVPPLAGNPEINDTAYVERTIREGLSGPLERLGETYDDEMEAFPELSDDEVAALISYVQSGFGAGRASAPKPMLPGDASRGERIFAGQHDLSKGGPSCFSCHTAGARGHLGGTGLGPDLTGLRERFKGEAKLVAALRKPPSPVMRQVYARRALSDEEVADLRVFFAEIEPSEPAGTDWLVLLGLAGTGALFAVHGILFAFIPKVSYSRKLRNSK
jgi:mono/diheme cytochrome c family protein